MPSPQPLQFVHEDDVGQAFVLVVDATKAKRDLGWTPRYTSLDALRDTVTALR